MDINLVRKTRFWRNLPYVCAGAASASFLYHLYWYLHFQLHSPREADVQNGLVYPFEIKGHPVYVSASDKNLSALAINLAVVFLLLFLVVAARAPQTNPPQDRQSIFDRRLAFPVSFFLMMGAYLVFGRSIADMLASHGIVLRGIL